MSPAVSSSPVSPLPRLDASAADFEALRALLAAHEYDVAPICARTESPAIYDFRMRKHARHDAVPERGLDILIGLFLDCYSLPVSEVERLVGPGSSALLMRLGLAVELDGQLTGTVLLYPNEGIYMISDRPGFSGTGLLLFESTTDLVYPAITNSGRTFLSTMPFVPGQRFLELCSGTGVAALMAARSGAAQAWAVDITARSTHFAAFNALLNGLPNVSALQGDLFAPVEGEQFDCIVAHPPYVPAATTEVIYRDGGEDGEQITRAILGRVAEFLAPGGIFHCTCIISARPEAPASLRVREMLGAAGDAFDMVLLGNGATDLATHFTKQLLKATDDKVPDIVSQLRYFQELAVQRVEFCTIILRRHDGRRKGGTIAVQRDGQTRWAEAEWLLRLQALLGMGEHGLDRLLNARPRLSPLAQFSLTYGVDPDAEERWVPQEGEVTVTYPFPGRVPVNAGDAAFLASCTGERTFAELLREIQEEGGIPADLDPRQFMRTMVPLVAEGVLETDLLPFPRHSTFS